MKLPYDYARCGGDDGDTICQNRDNCERYLQFNERGPRTLIGQWLCTDQVENIIRHDRNIPVIYPS